MRFRLAFVLLVLAAAPLLAGCAAPAAPADGLDIAPAVGPDALAFRAPVDVPLECRYSCYEPSIAVDSAGRVFISDGVTADLAVSDDGGLSWRTLAPPPPPEGAFGAIQSDVLVQVAPDDRLWFSALVIRQIPGIGSNILEGIQVAASDDGGATWSLDVYLTPAVDPLAAVYVPDRQWLGFAQDGAVYLTYNQIPTGIWSARSDDGGRTWSGWTRASPLEARGGAIGQSGPPVVGAAGRVLVPACAREGAASGVGVFASDDGGASFARVAMLPGGCSWFPILAVAPDGRIVAAWTTGVDVLVAWSEDEGASWTEPATWGEPAATSPWPLPDAEGSLVVAWFERDGDAATLRVARGTLEGGPTDDVVVVDDVRGASRTPANTDYAHIARLPDGRLATVWAQTVEGLLRAAFEQREDDAATGRGEEGGAVKAAAP